MADIYGVKTGKNGADGKALYEYDRVKFKVGAVTRTGTILNVCDPWYTEFKVLIDRFYWKFDNKPEYIDIPADAVTLVREDKNYRIHRTPEEFINYCKKYDYHQYKNAI